MRGVFAWLGLTWYLTYHIYRKPKRKICVYTQSGELIEPKCILSRKWELTKSNTRREKFGTEGWMEEAGVYDDACIFTYYMTWCIIHFRRLHVSDLSIDDIWTLLLGSYVILHSIWIVLFCLLFKNTIHIHIPRWWWRQWRRCKWNVITKNKQKRQHQPNWC